MAIDLKKDRRDLYHPPRDIVEVVVPPLRYLAIDGAGDPNTSRAYVDAVSALYTCGYAVRARLKARSGEAWTVGPLEGLWFSDDPATFVSRRKDQWQWTMLIALPNEATSADVEEGLTAARSRKPNLPVSQVYPLSLDEGRSLQVMHVGSYDDEGPTLARLHDEVMPQRGLTWNGAHHEIYLSDPRRVDASRLRTVLRQPVRPA